VAAAPNDDPHGIARRLALHDAQRTLAAKSELERVAAVARERKWQLVLLKASVDIAGGAILQFYDIDVLAAPEIAEQFAAQLTSLGYESYAEDRSYEQRTRYRQNSIPFDIHHMIQWRIAPTVGDAMTVQMRHSAVPLATYPPLLRLSPTDHLWHLLFHIAVNHPDRAGRLRDLCLVQRAADAAAIDASVIRARTKLFGSTLLPVLGDWSLSRNRRALPSFPAYRGIYLLEAFVRGRPSQNFWATAVPHIRRELTLQSTLRQALREETATWKIHRVNRGERGRWRWLPVRFGLAVFTKLMMRRIEKWEARADKISARALGNKSN
jgi:hypothetical protein